MNQFIPLKDWASRAFCGNPPHYVTLLALCRKGEIENAKKIGGKWYVDIKDTNTTGEDK